ncbi:MAG: Nramp family divalent metal transporter [Chthoniobacterales bacterium]|nr:Nramp family divalent metal transporter [Chthoniobacterales bacterium]
MTWKSLSESHRTIHIPSHLGFWRKLLAFTGPGFIVAVGYMDPGNWATDLAAGSQFNYSLLCVILISNVMAMLLQRLSLKLGIVTERDLAQACREHYSPYVSFVLWIFCELAIVACDLAEVIGSAIALNLLFHLPILWGVGITSLDTFALLFLQKRGFRYLEALVITLIGIIGICFGLEILFSHPSGIAIAAGFVPHLNVITHPDMLYIAIGILGATVMPHNLYLHSSIVQTRSYPLTQVGKKEAIRFASIDSNTALFLSMFINAAILIVAAATFFKAGRRDVVQIEDAYKLLTPMLGVTGASTLFGIALLAAGQNSTLTGTMAGQIVMEGFLNLKMKPWLRRLVTRSLAIVPTFIVVWIMGDRGMNQLLLASQVVLSMQLSFAVIPLVKFTNDPKHMGEFVNSRFMKAIAWTVAIMIAALNGWLLVLTAKSWVG